MTPDLAWEIARQYGIWAALAIIFVWALVKGPLRTQREFDADEKDRATAAANYERQLADLRRDYERQLADMTTDRNYWRDQAQHNQDRLMEALGIGERVTAVAKRVVNRP